MKRCIKLLSPFAACCLFHLGMGQDIPIDTWRTHFSYNSIEKMVYGNNKIFCATENGLFYVDLTDESTNLLTKNDGLSDANISAIAYAESQKALVIGYESGLVDIIQNGKITTISEIESSSIVGDKPINDIAISEDNIYLGTGYGIVMIPISTKEINENYRSIGIDGADVAVYELLITNDTLYAITDAGLEYSALAKNLLDFNNWKIFSGDPTDYSGLTATDTRPCLIYQDSLLLTFSEDTLTQIAIRNVDPILDLLWEDEQLYLLQSNALKSLQNGALQLVQSFTPATSVFTYASGFWIGTQSKGLLTPDGSILLPNGPLSDDISRIRFVNGNLYALYGPDVQEYNGESDGLGFSYFDNAEWTQMTLNNFYNLTDVAYYNGAIYFSSAGYGLYNYSTSSPLSGFDDAVIPGLAASDYLYLPLYGSSDALWRMDADGTLTSYDASTTGTSAPLSISVSQGETLWMRRSSSSGNGVVAVNLEEDEHLSIGTAYNLPSSTVNALAIDRTDEAWIATAAGIAVMTDATDPFNGYAAEIPIYDGDYLFEDEGVTTVAVDGGNRIWMATDEGLWIFDNNISENVDHFTQDNSPLPSNNISQLAYNPANGEMFILTDQGLVSYRSNSSQGDLTQHSHVKIFPNPVRPGYDGMVGISGLVQDASVKITDINGKLMREVEANGGTASWDLLDYNNHKVVTGIYIIFSASEDGTETYIGKLAVIR